MFYCILSNIPIELIQIRIAYSYHFTDIKRMGDLSKMTEREKHGKLWPTTGEEHIFLLDEDLLKEVLLQYHRKDRLIVVVSVVDALKYFFSGICMQR